jgi:SPP1 gp7 family putative phage head morphogenesis protein
MPTATNQKAAINDMTAQMDSMLNASQEEYIWALQDRYGEFENRLISDIRNIHIEAQGEGVASQDILKQFEVDAKVTSTIKTELLRLNQDVNESLFDEMVSQYKDAYNASAWTLDQATPPDVEPDYDIPTESYLREFLIQPWKGSMFSKRFAQINNDMAHDLQISVYQAMSSGQSAYNLGKTISGIIGTQDDGYKYQANMIARTELMRASNLAIEKNYDDNDDIINDWVWIDTSGMRTCDDCDERGGLTYDEVKEIADGQGLDLDPPIHPHCRCRWNASVKSWNELLGKDMAGTNEKIEPKPFSNWADENLDSKDRGNL